MYDIIEQIEHAAAGSVTDEIRLLKQRRKSLDHIIKFTLGINRLQQSLESVLLLKKPTTDIPRDLLKVLGNISDSVANLPSNELTKRLNRIEESVQKDMSTIMNITKQPDALDGTNPNQVDEISEQLQSLINDFRRRINTAIVLKLHLRSRGVKVAETTVPVTAEELVNQVSKLVVEERKCRTRTVDELIEMNNQMDLIISNDNYPAEMKKYAIELQQQVNQNIDHLNKGKDIEKLPFVIEIIQMGDNVATTEKENHDKPEKVNQGTSSEENITLAASSAKKSGFVTRLFKWISSPWSVKWRDIK